MKVIDAIVLTLAVTCFAAVCVLNWKISLMEQRELQKWDEQHKFNQAVIQTFNTPRPQ